MKRRNFIKNVLTLSMVTVGTSNMPVFANDEVFVPSKSVNALSLDKALKEIVGNAKIIESTKVNLKLPQIAENGKVVPVRVEVDSPMTKDNKD